MCFLISINHKQKNYLAAPTHNIGVPYGYSHIIKPKSGTYIMGLLAPSIIVSKLSKSPIAINEDLSIENFSNIIFEQLKMFMPLQAIISKGNNILIINNDVITISQRFSCIGDRSIYGALLATDGLNMDPEQRIKLALKSIGEQNFEFKIF